MAVEFVQVNPENGQPVQVFINLDPDAEGKAYEIKQAGYELRMTEFDDGKVTAHIYDPRIQEVHTDTIVDTTSDQFAAAVTTVLNAFNPVTDVAVEPVATAEEAEETPAEQAEEVANPDTNNPADTPAVTEPEPAPPEAA